MAEYKKVIIEIPEGNAFVGKVTLNKTLYRLRMAYNDTRNFWYFGLYESDDTPIAVGIKIIPNINLNMFFGNKEIPGYFIAESKLKRIGRYDFITGKATFSFVYKE